MGSVEVEPLCAVLLRQPRGFRREPREDAQAAPVVRNRFGAVTDMRAEVERLEWGGTRTARALGR